MRHETRQERSTPKGTSGAELAFSAARFHRLLCFDGLHGFRLCLLFFELGIHLGMHGIPPADIPRGGHYRLLAELAKRNGGVWRDGKEYLLNMYLTMLKQIPVYALTMDSVAPTRNSMIGGLLPVRDRHFFDAATAPVYGVIALMALMVISAVASGLFNYSVPLARDTGLAVLIFLVLAWLARWIGFQLIAASTEAVILFLLIAFLAPCCAVIMAATNLPLADDTLLSIDSLIGFDRTTVIPPVNAIPWINRASVWVYNSFTVQPFLLLLLLIATRRSRRAWTLLTAWGIALIISLVVFAFVPAFGTPPYVLDFVDVLRGARDGSLRTLDESALTGIITFPSFHAAGATLLAWGFASFGRIAAPLVLLNVAVIASALISGGHYLVDLPAGMLVAGIAIRLAQSVHRQSDDHVAEGRLTACL